MSDTLPWPFYTEPKHIDVHGLDVTYRREGSGEPVVYLHGAGLTRRWLPFYEKASQSVDFIVPDHPGFGDVEMPEWLDDFSDVVIHYAEFLDALNLEKVHLVGHSFGGWIAAEIAVFYPDRLKSLQLITPAGLEGSDLHDGFRQNGEEALERIFNGNAEMFPEYTDDGEDAVEAQVQAYKELTTRGRLAWQPRFDRKLPRRLERVQVPTQILLAQEDRVLSTEAAKRYADYIPGATTRVVETDSDIPTSHLPFVQAPDVLAGLVTDFVAENA